MRTYANFERAIESIGDLMRVMSYEVKGARWQSIDVSTKPEMRMKEVLNVSFQVMTQGIEEPTYYHNDIQPNYPWAEDHFQERVAGQPLNPGEQWKNWPWALSADKFRTEGEKFSHTYMERYWPKNAGSKPGELTSNGFDCGEFARHGIRYKYGDLNDVVNHLLGDPLSRQAYLPIWFPEDTGVVHGERVPCSLGYHWILRNGYLHTTYYIRSCDFYRHFRDDLYLSIRLSIWLLQQLRETEQASDHRRWNDVKLGFFVFHCVSMHMFVNDWNKLYGQADSESP
jgi:hypothetical protein